MTQIKPIETSYKGYRFRSRLEARWAVFFDEMKIEWEYEKQGFELDLGDWFDNPPQGVTLTGKQCYLPDFWLPQVRMFVEVKSEWPSVNELALAARLAQSGFVSREHGYPESKTPVLILDGTPSARMYWAVHGLDFEHGGWDLALVEYDIGEGHYYWLDEHRFFWHDMAWATDHWQPPYHSAADECSGVVVARSARFEHGECG